MDSGALAMNAWQRFWDAASEERRLEGERVLAEAEARRAAADYNTGSITAVEATLLRSLAEHVGASVVIEIGTFIGASTHALAASDGVAAVYTCDASNDCVQSDGIITSFPRASSTQMLRALVSRGVRADLCFFDGVVQKADLSPLARLCGPQAVFAVHDYNYGPKIRSSGAVVTVPRKGIGNIQAIASQWPTHVLTEPMAETTLAAWAPKGRL